MALPSNFECLISNCSPNADSSIRPIFKIFRLDGLDKSAFGEQFEIRHSKLRQPRVVTADRVATVQHFGEMPRSMDVDFGVAS
jgi:hypothetical protein